MYGAKSLYSPAVLLVLLYWIIRSLNLTLTPGFALLCCTTLCPAGNMVCFMFHFKDPASYYESSSWPGAALGKPLEGVCELSQPRCGNSSAGLCLMAGVACPCTVMDAGVA